MQTGFLMKQKRKIMIVAGEASGDAHAAKLVEALRANSPETDFEFFGAAGRRMREAGVESILDSDDFAIVGLPEIVRALPMFWRAFQKLKSEAVRRKPNVVILVDFPEFNLKLAKALKKKNLRIVYYISPQLWAWRKYRVRAVAKYVDLLLTILPFEKDWYARRGVGGVEYVGNPLAREVFSNLTKEDFCAEYKLDFAKPIIALLPGSRSKEIARILPPLVETAALMSEKNNDLQFVVALASAAKIDEIEAIIKNIADAGLKLPENLKIVAEQTREVLNAADAAAVTSGTATLETAIIGTPLAVVYKTSGFNYGLIRPLITVEHFGLVNLIAGERLAAEFIQDDFTIERLAAEIFRLLDKNVNTEMRRKLKSVSESLGTGGASTRAAEAILKLL